MIKYKKLSWSNVFSYGENNTLILDANPLTQLLGKNGFGKSSIALIIEEVQFNTNSKKIKKADILNRNSKSKNYTIELEFEKDGVPYTISTTRTSSSGTVSLLCNGKDISSHTATGTYKQIEQILGYDSKSFSQIVYQSNASSLEFLTATDTARKKFLIDLLNLSKYTVALDVFKNLASGMSKQVDTTQTKLNTIQAWLKKYEKEDLVIQELEEEIAEPVSINDRITILKNDLSNITSINKRISQNNAYKKILESIDIATLYNKPDTSSLQALQLEHAEVIKKLKEGNILAVKCKGPVIPCPTCGQDMDNSVMFSILQKFEANRAALEVRRDELASIIASIEAAKKAWDEYDRRLQEWVKYYSLYDKSLDTVVLDADVINKDIAALQASADAITAAIISTRKRNALIIEHNSKVKVISAQMKDMTNEAKELSDELVILIDELTKLQILVKTFSSTGLISYKIECMVKDLEELTNEYLSVMSSGRFQLSFVLVADKLNVVITDNGKDIGIEALSSGERARVNTSTLLAIRKLMQSLSSTRTNLLILDETIESLDIEGKELLVEVLLKEESLNTILVSHSFNHPLIEKISVVKEHNISRLE